MGRRLFVLLAVAIAVGVAALRAAGVGDATDPARNDALPCENVSTQGGIPRAAHGIVHVANVCGFVGTDVELQSRKDSKGKVHDYAFVGTMGAGMRIFDVTDRAHPTSAGGYVDSGWENDVQLRGNLAVATYDGVNGEDSSASTCLKTRYPTAHGQGIDLYRLVFDAAAATFDVQLLGCVANPPGGAHNASIHPSGNWLAILNCCSDWAIDVVDLRGPEPVLRYRFIDSGHANTTATTGDARCPAPGGASCVEMQRPDGGIAVGLWRPHDIFYSPDGRTAYVAAINSTWIVDVSHVLGVIGGLHFYALAPLPGEPSTAAASPANPVKLGDYFIPNPTMLPDPLSAGATRSRGTSCRAPTRGRRRSTRAASSPATSRAASTCTSTPAAPTSSRAPPRPASPSRSTRRTPSSSIRSGRPVRRMRPPHRPALRLSGRP